MAAAMRNAKARQEGRRERCLEPGGTGGCGTEDWTEERLKGRREKTERELAGGNDDPRKDTAQRVPTRPPLRKHRG